LLFFHLASRGKIQLKHPIIESDVSGETDKKAIIRQTAWLFHVPFGWPSTSRCTRWKWREILKQPRASAQWSNWKWLWSLSSFNTFKVSHPCISSKFTVWLTTSISDVCFEQRSLGGSYVLIHLSIRPIWCRRVISE
jgi:hypothetical protein